MEEGRSAEPGPGSIALQVGALGPNGLAVEGRLDTRDVSLRQIASVSGVSDASGHLYSRVTLEDGEIIEPVFETVENLLAAIIG